MGSGKNNEDMDDDFEYALTSLPGEKDQDMGLISMLHACPVLSHLACEEEREDFEEVMEETCALNVTFGHRRRAFQARA